VPNTTNGDTLGEALNLCKMVSTHIFLGEMHYHAYPKRERIGPIAQDSDETMFG
jgi:hypothetical protein